MSRRYRRVSYSRRSTRPAPVVLLILLIGVFLREYWQLVLAVVAVALCGVLIIYFIKRSKPDDLDEGEQTPPVLEGATSSTYARKASIMSDCERAYFEAIKKMVEPRYSIQPQINLASVIDKTTHDRYRNELFRNIDFGVFDKEYKLLVLIEINDQTHRTHERKERDKKVQAICSEANIPLITLWTQYGVNETYIKSRLSCYLNLCEDIQSKAEQ